ncbi:hypothetical protein D3C73_1406120 [compost metagenome]
MCFVVEISVLTGRIKCHHARPGSFHIQYTLGQRRCVFAANQTLFGEHDNMRLVDVTQIVEAIGKPFQTWAVDVLVYFRRGGFLQAPTDFGFLHHETPQ